MMASRGQRRASVGPLAGVFMAALALVCAVAPALARADEALLPSPDDLEQQGLSVEPDESEVDEPVDPTDQGHEAPIGAEPEGLTLDEELDAYFARNFSASGLPGLAVAVVSSDEVRYEATFGDVESVDDTFLVGSLSKSLTALSIMQLVERGLVDLDAPAVTYAPGYDVSPVVSVRDLLNQTSGFGYYESLADVQVGDTLGSFSYANANYDLLGRIVENVSGLTYGSYLRKNVFGPLGMADASVPGEVERAPEAAGHRSWFGTYVADGFIHEQGDDAWGGPASGYVRASLSDMVSYLQMYLNSGAGALSAAGIHRMVFDRVSDGGDTYYGMGWTTYTWDDGELVLSHDGQVENYVARMCVLPGRDLAVVMLADANDEFGGNDTFFSMGDDVLTMAIGAEPQGIDAAEHVESHVAYDVVYALALAAAAAPLVLTVARTLKGRRPRRTGVARGILSVGLHVLLPVYLLGLPGALGMRFEDFADFYPDQAVVLVACTALLAAAGSLKLVLWLHARRQKGTCQ